MKLVVSSSQCVRFTFQYNGRDERSGSKGKECSRCKSVIGTVRDPVRKANASRWEFQAFNAMLHFEKKQEMCT